MVFGSLLCFIELRYFLSIKLLKTFIKCCRAVRKNTIQGNLPGLATDLEI